MISLFTDSILSFSLLDLSLVIVLLCEVGVAVSLGAPMLICAAKFIVANAALYSCLRFVAHLRYMQINLSIPKDRFSHKSRGFSGQPGCVPEFDGPHSNGMRP